MISYEDFEKVDIRIGRITAAEDFPEARKPAIKLTIDFGPEIGIKRSSAQLIGAYQPSELVWKLGMGVVNFAPKHIGPFVSEVLTLGFKNTDGGGFVLAVPDKENVEVGDKLR
ncbi:MAG TPA: tRNA-binding protein [Candidatus Paceibacterota bacterium]|nr:tRNA-binding protein [Candidatus Paceibacterota bacterium]